MFMQCKSPFLLWTPCICTGYDQSSHLTDGKLLLKQSLIEELLCGGGGLADPCRASLMTRGVCWKRTEARLRGIPGQS